MQQFIDRMLRDERGGGGLKNVTEAAISFRLKREEETGHDSD
jgi:hypothetical protein